MSRRRLVVVGALAAVAVVLGWAVVAALGARADATRARERIVALRDDDAVTTPAGVRAVLRSARADLRHGLDRLDDPGPALVARVPVLGRSWVALDRSARAALAAVDATDAAVVAVSEGRPLLAGRRIDVDRLQDVARALTAQAERMAPAVAALDRLDTGWTPPQVGRGVAAARADLSGVPASLHRAADALLVLRETVGASEPRRLLIVLQNNAELRGAGGLISVFAQVSARNGQLDIAPFRDVVDVAESPEHVRRVPAPADYVSRYGRFLANTTLWRNANMSPDVPVSAGVLAELAATSLRWRPDAVLMLDVRAIAAILDGTGPAQLPDGETLTGAEAVEELLVKAYAEAPDTRAGQDERRRRLRRAADAIVARLFQGEPALLPLAAELGRAAAGRHLALWSARPDEQRALVEAGLSGQVRTGTSDLVMVTTQNLGGGQAEGNKLDYYARRTVSVDVVVGSRTATTTVRVRLRNTAPERGLARYVAGFERPGESRNLVAFAVPRGAELERFHRDGEPRPVTVADEGTWTVVEDVAVIAPGGATEWLLVYRVPVRGRYDLRLVPQPLAVDADLTVRVRTEPGVYLRADGELRLDGNWDRDTVLGADVERGRWWQRVGNRLRRWWNEPVQLPG